MLLYGDGKQATTLHGMLERCRALVRSNDLDSLRLLLILTGEIEQAAEDTCLSELAALDREATDWAATAFCLRYGGAGETACKSNIEQSVARCLLLLERMRLHGDREITIKVPEGFAFYALYPEQYCIAAEKWAASRGFARGASALVIGVRSIGTTLSAVVAAMLRSIGWKVARHTVRPEGHPFQRRVSEPPLGRLARTLAPPGTQGVSALVVDEGPGLSGSSMAAVADWLERGGIDDVAFLPGHAHDPGPNATDGVRNCWARISRFCCSLEEIKWNRQTLMEILSDASTELAVGAIQRVEDLSAGNWRKLAFEDQSEWPVVFGMLERTKFLCHGTRGAVLWKFDGLMAESATESERIRALADSGFVPKVLDRRMGFVAMPWIEGKRLISEDAHDRELLDHVVEYVCRSAERGRGEFDLRVGVERLAMMFRYNAKELLGEESAEMVSELEQAALDCAQGPAYGDGHLAPHEWVRTGRGKLIKTDSFGHTRDHTLVGRQSILWDVAGLIIEWDLDPPQIERVVSRFQTGGYEIAFHALRFYLCAYAAFRVGILSYSMRQAGEDRIEGNRALRRLEAYKGKLRYWLGAGVHPKRAITKEKETRRPKIRDVPNKTDGPLPNLP